jgi:ribosomal protein L18
MEKEMLSLYDYLGYAAGDRLGKDVAKKAAEQKVTYAVKYVENPKYKGEIMMYPKSFLDSYFKLDVNDDLPF